MVHDRGTGGPADVDDPNEATLAAYRCAAQRYLDASARPAPALLAYLDKFADIVGTGPVLELGSGPGWDADHLEARGVRVIRSDATSQFVQLLRAAGHEALTIDLRSDDLRGPYRGVLADAVLLHLTRQQFKDALRCCRVAVTDGGVLGFTLKEGDGAGWSKDKLDLPRYFTYWREPALREVVTETGWEIVDLDHVPGGAASWLHVLAVGTTPDRTDRAGRPT